ncbi:MAG: DUF6166 domain-containing protein [Candidatus Dormibacteria bacterium]
MSPTARGRYYLGRRSDAGRLEVLVHDAQGDRPLEHVVFHSPDGFECGYAGSGPADLSLSILADALSEDGLAAASQAGERLWFDGSAAFKLHQQYKADVVSRLPERGFVLDADSVRSWAQKRLDPMGIDQLFDGYGSREQVGPDLGL